MDKLVLLPICVGNQERLKEEATKRGLDVMVIENDDLLFPLLEKHKPKAIVGVCCPMKIAQLTPKLNGTRINYRAVPAGLPDVCFYKGTNQKTEPNIQEYCLALDWLVAHPTNVPA